VEERGAFWMKSLKKTLQHVEVSPSELSTWIEVNYGSSLPLVCIDEVPVVEGRPKWFVTVRFLRNVIRAANIPLVVCGTNARAANMIDTGSRESEQLWCFLTATFPPFVPPGVVLPKGALASFIEAESRTCRPWMASLMYEYGVHGDGDCPRTALWQLADNVGETVYKFKSSVWRTPGGFAGQVFMWHASSSGVDDLNTADSIDDTNSLINCHFADLRLDKVEKDYSVTADGILRDARGKELVISIAYPIPEIDSILYLACAVHSNRRFVKRILGSSEGIRPVETLYSYCDARSEIRVLQKRCERAPPSDRNPNAKIPDWVAFEAFCAGAMISASWGSFAGTRVHDFLMSLVEQAHPKTYNSTLDPEKYVTTLDPSIASVDGFWLGVRIPFLGPCNRNWPERLLTFPGCHFGTLHRPENRFQADGFIYDVVSADATTVGVSMECKCRADNLSPSVFVKEIAGRVPKSSKLHFVFCLRASEAKFFLGSGDFRKTIGEKRWRVLLLTVNDSVASLIDLGRVEGEVAPLEGELPPQGSQVEVTETEVRCNVVIVPLPRYDVSFE